MLLIDMLLGCTLMLSGMLCIVHELWANTEAEGVAVCYTAGSLFAVMGLVLFFNAVH